MILGLARKRTGSIVGIAAAVWAACAMGGCATLYVESEPPGAEIYVKGQLIGNTPCSRVYSIFDVPDLRAAGVLPGHQVSECVQLPRKPDMVPIETAPPGALVYANGSLLGKTPFYTDSAGVIGCMTSGGHYRAVFPSEAQAAEPPHGAASGPGRVSCDLRLIEVGSGSGVASAGGDNSSGGLAALAKELAGKLKVGVPAKGATVAVVSLRNRAGTPGGKVTADELADKVQGALIDTGWFDVKERIDLRGVLNETDLDAAGLVKNENVRKQLAGVKYVVIGGVTVTDAQRKP
jgi:hypothetical protein